ncbi:MAG: hypothetical protein U1F52_06625 [Burkholderiales bacterium]
MPSRSSVRLLAAASLGALGLIAAPGARAVFMPPAGFLEETGVTSIADIHGTDPLLAESIAFDNRIPSIASGHGRAATSGGSIPMASAHVDLVSETVYRDIWGGAYASVDYYFMLEQTGGTPVTEQIPLDIVTRGGIAGSATEHAGVGDVYARATVYIDTHDVDVPQGVHSCIPLPCSGAPKSFESAFTGYAVPEQPIRVSLVASVSGSASRPGASFSGDAWVDPVITISPGYARRADFRLVFSEGVTAVPEPGTWASLAAGLASMLLWQFGLHRRRRAIVKR